MYVRSEMSNGILLIKEHWTVTYDPQLLEEGFKDNPPCLEKECKDNPPCLKEGCKNNPPSLEERW